VLDAWAAQSPLVHLLGILHYLRMRYRIEFGDEALAALRGLPKELRRNVGFRLDQLQDDLAGDVKKLKGGVSNTACASGTIASFSPWKRTLSSFMLCVTEKRLMSNSATPSPVTLESVQRELRELRELRERLEVLEDREDLRDLRAAKAMQAGKPGIPWAKVKEELGID